MSDETPTNEPAPTPAPETPAPEAPAASTPAPEAPATPVAAGAETPAAPEPTAEAPVETPAAAAIPPEPEAAPAAPAAPAPAAAAPAPAAAAPAAAAPAGAAAPAAEPVVAPTSSSHVAVPKWVLATLAAVLGAAVMFGIGYAVGDSGSSDDDVAISTPQAPSLPGNQGNGNGGPQQAPGFPGGNQGGSQPGANPSTSGAFLGVATQQAPNGLEVVQVVSGSAADDAGIEVGDVIVEFEGNDVTTPAQLANAVGNLDPGDEVEITYERDGETDTVTVELGSRGTTNSN